jgi:ComF family protein
LREAVLYLKYHDRRGLARELGVLMADRLEEMRGEWQPEALVPVPIHRQRRRERGYNQSELLAAVVGERCGLPVRDALEKVKDTPPQVGLTREERLRNVRDAFKSRAGAASGRRAVLIDDVQTTGETLEEAAKALLAAGAHAVYALTLCWEGTVRRR